MVGSSRSRLRFEAADRLPCRALPAPLAAGFEKPSAIQQKGIVPFGKGLDVIQQAQSGTGKTATFCAGILQVRCCCPLPLGLLPPPLLLLLLLLLCVCILCCTVRLQPAARAPQRVLARCWQRRRPALLWSGAAAGARPACAADLRAAVG